MKSRLTQLWLIPKKRLSDPDQFLSSPGLKCNSSEAQAIETSIELLSSSLAILEVHETISSYTVGFIVIEQLNILFGTYVFSAFFPFVFV